MQVTRRQFFKVCAGGLGASSMAMLGFASNDALAEVREFKLTRTTETRNTCPYCSVGCGILIYNLGDKAKNVNGKIIQNPEHWVDLEKDRVTFDGKPLRPARARAARSGAGFSGRASRAASRPNRAASRA